MNVVVIGAAGGIGQPLSCFLKTSQYVRELRLYDVRGSHGIAADISHIPSRAKVFSYLGTFDKEIQEKQLQLALNGADLVVISAGIPRKPGMSRQDLFNVNAGIMKSIIESVSIKCPKAFVAIISNPVNSLVPLAAQILKSKGLYNPRKLCGITQLDVLRARSFIANKYEINPEEIDIPVIGGHAGTTIVPLLSQCSYKVNQEDKEELIVRIQNAGTEVVEAKEGTGSATLSMAVAANMFLEQVMKGLTGEGIGKACAYVDIGELEFFADMCIYDYNGLILNKIVPDQDEQYAVDEMMPQLIASHKAAFSFLEGIQ